MTQKIHLVFKTHLDIGFTDYAKIVLQNYFKGYIPAAIRVAKEMTARTSAGTLYLDDRIFSDL